MEGSLQIGIQSHPPPSIGNAHPDTPSRLNGRRRKSHGGGVPPMETLTSSGGLTSHTLTTQEPAVRVTDVGNHRERRGMRASHPTLDLSI